MVSWHFTRLFSVAQSCSKLLSIAINCDKKRDKNKPAFNGLFLLF